MNEKVTPYILAGTTIVAPWAFGWAFFEVGEYEKAFWLAIITAGLLFMITFLSIAINTEPNP